MKIAYIYDAVHPWETGGIQKRVWELSRRLALNNEVHWYGLQYWDGNPTIERDDVILHGVMEPDNLYKDGRRSISEAISFSLALSRPLLKERFDIIDCQQFPYFPIFPSKINTIRYDSELVLTWHEVWREYWYDYLGWKGYFGKEIENFVAQVPDHHIAVSRRTEQDVINLGVSHPQYLPNGVDFTEIDTVTEATKDIDILFVGRLIKEKGVDLLLRAISEIKDQDPTVRCLIIGNGPERAALQSLIYSLGLTDHVDLLDFRDSYKEILSLMKAANIFTLLSRREGFGISALEALACGTPVVTINHPQNAVQELIDNDQIGRVCQPTPKAVAAAIMDVRNNSHPKACKAFARSYEWDTIAKKTELYYKRLLSE